MKKLVYTEMLPDFLDSFVFDENKGPRKYLPRPFVDTMFQQLQFGSLPAYNAELEIYRTRVEAFWNPQLSIKKFGALPLFLYAEGPVICPFCGNVDIVSHDSLNRRWKCKQCGTFTWGVNKGLHFPFELYDAVLSSFLEGDDLARINGEVRKEAERRGLRITAISSEAVYSIVRRACIILGYFEPIAIRKLTYKEIKLGTVEMDYTPYAIYTLGSRIKQHDLKNKNINFHQLLEKYGSKELSRLGTRKRIFVYTTGAISIESRYPPPMVTDYSFDFRRSLKCIDLMVQTFGSKPTLMKCDGAICHKNAIKMSLPDVELYTRTKAQCYNIVNYMERYWEELEDDCMGPYRFRSLGTAQLAVELKRFQHIFLRPHSNLNGKTPAEHIGIKIPRSITQNQNEKWQRLLKFAFNVIVMEINEDLRKFFS